MVGLINNRDDMKKPSNPIVKGGLIEVWDRPGLEVDFMAKETKKYLS
ncbi:MAG: hypothetical protein ABIR66_07205 [Saprospiraceae bacterium]